MKVTLSIYALNQVQNEATLDDKLCGLTPTMYAKYQVYKQYVISAQVYVATKLQLTIYTTN